MNKLPSSAPPITVSVAKWALAAFGFFVIVIGLSSGGICEVSGLLCSTTTAFWFRFLAQLVGLWSVGAVMVMFSAREWRVPTAIAIAGFSILMSLSPIYFLAFAGPLCRSDASPLQMITGLLAR